MWLDKEVYIVNSKDILEKVMKDEKVTQKELATAMGLKSQQAIGNMLTRQNSIRLESYVKMLNKMGYEVIVRKKKEVGKSEEWEIDEQ